MSAVLRELRLESASYRRLELRAPYRLAFQQAGIRGVHIVVRGRCEIVLDGSAPILLEPGDLVIAPRADAHLLCSVGDRRSRIVPASELLRHADGARIRFGGAGEETTIVCGAFFFHTADHPALRGLPRLIHVRGDLGRAPSWLGPYIDALTTEAFEAGPGSEVVSARLSDALVARALRFHLEEAATPGWLHGLGDAHVAKALGALHDDLPRRWTLSTLARSAGLSRTAFAMRFAARVGEPPMRYLLRCRMQAAMTMLRDQDATLASVAKRVGYGSEAAFSAAFKRHTRQSPGSYARRARKTFS